jgi:hypothetical protein
VWKEDGTVLELQTLEPLDPTVEYSIMVHPGAMSLNGLLLEEPHEVYFKARPPIAPPQMLSTSPFDGQIDAYTGQAIDIVFDQPMNTSSVENAVTISPAIEYRVYWTQDDTVASLQPLKPIAFNTTYSVTVGTGSTSADGIPMETEYGFEFATGLEDSPRVTGALPILADTGIPSNHPIHIVFDHRMDQDSVNQALSITPTLAHTITWREAGFIMVIEPMEGFEPGSYTIEIGTDARSRVGLPLADGFSWNLMLE